MDALTQSGNNVNYTTSAVSLTCASGFYGSPTYTCTGTTNPGTFSSAGTTCSAVTCSLPVETGYSAKSGLTYTSSDSGLTTTCNRTGYTSTIYYTCPANPTSTSVAGSIVSGSSCACASGYAKNASGVCVRITCTVPTVNTTSDGNSVNYKTTATSLTCKTGFTGSPTYTCTGTTNPGTFSSAGTTCSAVTCSLPTVNTTLDGASVNYTTTATPLTCKSGYTGSPTYTCIGSGTFNLSGSCTSNSASVQCTIPYTVNSMLDGNLVDYTTSSVSLTCKTGFTGSPTYTCTGSSNPGSVQISGSCSQNNQSSQCIGPCSQQQTKCYAKERDGFAGTNYVDVVLSGSWEAMVADSYRIYIDNRMANNMGRSLLPLVNRFKLYDVYHGGVSYTSQDSSWSFFGPINLSYVPQSANVSAFRSMSSSSSYVEYGVKSNHVLTKYARILNYGNNSFSCDSGYSGTLTYNCQTDGSTLDPSSGTCSMITCNVPSSTNSTIDNTPVNFTSSPVSITCKSGYLGSPSYTCLPNGDSPTGMYVPGGLPCSANNCNVPAIHNFNMTSTGQATNATPTNCATGYAYGSTRPTYTCDTSTTPGTFTKVSGNCSPIACTVPASENTTSTVVNFAASPVSLTCASGFYGAQKYTCLSNGNSLSGLYTSVGIPCAPIKCYAKDRVGLSGTNYFDNVSAGTQTIEAWSSLFRIYHENQSNSPYLLLVNRIKLFDVYHGPLTFQSKPAWYIYNFNPINRSQFSKTSYPSYFIYQSPELYNVKSTHAFTKYARILDFGNNINVNCDSGFTGTLVYNCQTDGSTLDPISGTCTAN
jgi:hypothetical protein